MKVQIKDVIQAFTERVILNMTFDKKLALLKEVTPGHLKDRYRHFECFDPLSFLSGSKERVHIEIVYTKIVLQQENTPLDIDSLDILKALREGCQPFPPVQDDRPRLAVVSGIAGSGKTTLLTFMVSEWRREECDRRVKHLEEYDIVLRILCRDKHAEDLETFLRLVLPPSLSVFGEPLVNYLERCKVLFLIDGLDEMNQTSEKLVTNVMTIATCNKQFSIIVTSRPERVDWLLRRYGQDYRLSQLSIEGIPVTKRTEFALKYSTSSTNQERLKEFMAQQKYHKLFELPLNLLFVVTLFEDNPDSIKKHITQASLYTHFHDWCTEKLRVRIATHPAHEHTRPLTLKTRIKRVLKEMYQMALQGLLQDRLTLSEEETERLEKHCKKEELPEQDVLGAFYTLRLFVNNRVREEQYSLPHKGLLEYFAARHIIQSLQDESLPPLRVLRSLLHTCTQPQPQPRTPGAVRRVLHTVTQHRTFRGQRNLFFHVAGLLAKEEVPNRPEAIKEVIELVADTGARGEEWLSLVEHTDYDESFLRAIAHHFTENPTGDTIWITDSTLASAAALLPILHQQQWHY
ncbi:NACHT, LRR and PYD domains-containing protein 1 homolog [Portunus trituberculatus]|uniref:NACHT, LRR and PYD domains-containing protein 1 homolog n=1 Tax=Portunus trituberculatus TaxID=210409 RepID=UPI001E1CFC48|nr:NACHT, LRR and PYD domains-containing protein 1 homolog [Portunus trituberculatus]XP_045105452.1 NACHT, LRR and PYD domains-containing protein 1 homolog [Portunus trituberculatus]